MAKITDGLTLGRSLESDVVFHDPLVSRLHARCVVRDDGVDLVDLGSANGTDRNGKRIDRVRLAAGDRIRVGDAEFVFEADDAPVAADATPVAVASHRRSLLGRTTVRLRASVPAPAATDPSDTLVVGDVVRSTQVAEPPAAEPQVPRLARFALGAARFAKADVALVLIRQVPGGPFIVAGRYPSDDEVEPPPAPRSLLARASRLGQALLLASEAAEGRDPGDPRPRSRASAMCAPIGGPAGDGAVVYVERRGPATPFAEADLAPFAQLAAAVAPSLDRELQWSRWRVETDACSADRSDAVLVGESAAFLAMLDVMEHVAAARAPVVVRGEPGSGRRLVARHLHERSRGRRHPFVALCSASLPRGDELTALVGEVAGGLRRPGLFEDVGFGTLCLVEVSHLAAPAQVALAQALASSRYTPVGATESRLLRCRIVATTSANLDPLAASGAFHPQLASALSGVTVGVPSLADRGDDVRLLAEYFAGMHGRRVRGHAVGITDGAHAFLRRRTFRGNVAELSNAVESAVLHADSDELDVTDFETHDLSSPASVAGLRLEDAERTAIVRALEASGGRKGRAAEILGISWPTLTRKIREYKID